MISIDIKNRHINYQLRCNRSALRNRTVCVGKRGKRRPPLQYAAKRGATRWGGQAKLRGKQIFPEGSVTHLNSQARAWENKGYHHFILVEDGPVIIKCDKCGASLSCSNPSQSTSIHTTACTARKREYEDAAQGERGRAQERTTRIQGVLPVAAASSLSPSGSGPWTTHW